MSVTQASLEVLRCHYLQLPAKLAAYRVALQAEFDATRGARSCSICGAELSAADAIPCRIDHGQCGISAS